MAQLRTSDYSSLQKPEGTKKLYTCIGTEKKKEEEEEGGGGKLCGIMHAQDMMPERARMSYGVRTCARCCVVERTIDHVQQTGRM